MLGAAGFVAGALLGALLTQGTPAAWAGFHETARSSAGFSADVLHPPSGLVGTWAGCGQLGGQVNLQWTASPSPGLERYDVLLATASAGPYILVPPPSGHSPTATSRPVGGLDRKQTYFVVVRSVRGSWWTATTPLTVQTPNTKC